MLLKPILLLGDKQARREVYTMLEITVRHKILMGEILTNLMNFQQSVNIFPIKIFRGVVIEMMIK